MYEKIRVEKIHPDSFTITAYGVNPSTWSIGGTGEIRMFDPVEIFPTPKSTLKTCSYCHGTTRDDRHGHCIACGAPRKV
jgi:hypothetical protein